MFVFSLRKRPTVSSLAVKMVAKLSLDSPIAQYLAPLWVKQAAGAWSSNGVSAVRFTHRGGESLPPSHPASEKHIV